MVKIFKLYELDLSKLTFSEPIDNIIYITYDNNQAVVFETPDLFYYDKINLNKTKYSTYELLVTLLSKTEHYTNITKSFFESLDNKLIQLGQENINEWPFTSKNVKYKSLIKTINDKEEFINGLIKVKFIKNKNFNTLLFNNKKIVPINDYEKILHGNGYVKLIMQLVSIWIKNDVYGAYFKLYQVKTNADEILDLDSESTNYDELST
jgi:hypothetical protein